VPKILGPTVFPKKNPDISPKWDPRTATGTMTCNESKSILKTNTHIENKIRLDTIKERMKDSIKAKMNIAIHANSLLELKNNSIFSNIYKNKKDILLQCTKIML
tara:strand:- start:126 stop:437 length:312 start_codon:yes stop_codon:yes gene_type:complete